MNDVLDALLGDLGEFTQETTAHIPWQPPEADAGTPAAQSPRAVERVASGRNVHSLPELHQKARVNFDAKAEALLGLLVSTPAAPGEASAGPRAGSEQVVTRLPGHARLSETHVFRDGGGAVAARAFTHDGYMVGLQRDGYRALRTLSEAMQSTAALRSVVVVESLEALIFDWVHARVAGRTDRPMSDIVLDELAAQVAAFEAVIPLFRVELPEPLTVGRVILRTVTAADFARWESATTPDQPSEVATHQRMFAEERRRMQGFAAATLTVVGECERALEVAFEEADRAAALLRLFSPAMLSPWARSFCAPWGRENIEAPAFLLFDPGSPRLLAGRRMDTPHDFVWRLDGARVRLIREGGFDALANRLFAGEPSGFAGEVRAALLLYSQTALRGTPTEKLMAVVLPLESFLRRNGTENITENFALRLALATGATRDERRRIAALAKNAYELRSRYVHHGKAVTDSSDVEAVQAFMRVAWRFFVALGLQVVSRYPDRLAYLAALDDEKFGSDP